MTFLTTLACVVVAQAQPVPEPPPGVPAQSGAAHFRGALETLFESFPSGPVGGSQDLFGVVTPSLDFEGGEDFALALGASLRLRLFDDPPEQRAFDFGGVLRREDWDQPSDFGQVLRLLRIGREGGGFYLWAGPAVRYTLGRGHLVSRFSNQASPDYHPAAGALQLSIGPTRTEVFASDLLGARLFAAEVSADLARLLGKEQSADWFHVALSVAHDAGRAGGATGTLSLMELDLDASLHRSEAAQVVAFAGVGSRFNLRGADLGAALGLSADWRSVNFRLGGKAELRKVGGGFRFGMFGPAHELSRFAGTGLSGAPLADEVLPDSFSGYGELQLESGDPGSSPEPYFALSLGGEHFAFGRTDLDALLSAKLAQGRALASVHLSLVGLGVLPRYSMGLEARWRFMPSLYAAARGGTVFFPQPDSSLSRGVYVGVGVGADFER